MRETCRRSRSEQPFRVREDTRVIAARPAGDDAFVIIHCGKQREAAFITLEATATNGGEAIALAADLSSVCEVQQFCPGTQQRIDPTAGFVTFASEEGRWVAGQ